MRIKLDDSLFSICYSLDNIGINIREKCNEIEAINLKEKTLKFISSKVQRVQLLFLFLKSQNVNIHNIIFFDI